MQTSTQAVFSDSEREMLLSIVRREKEEILAQLSALESKLTTPRDLGATHHNGNGNGNGTGVRATRLGPTEGVLRVLFHESESGPRPWRHAEIVAQFTALNIKLATEREPEKAVSSALTKLKVEGMVRRLGDSKRFPQWQLTQKGIETYGNHDSE